MITSILSDLLRYRVPLRHTLLSCLILIFVFPILGFAQRKSQKTNRSGISMSAERMIRDAKRGTVTLSGKVQLVFEENYLSADEAVIDLNQKKIDARGKVVLTNTEVYTESEELTYHYELKTGLFKNAFVQSGQVVFEGELIEKTGPKEYIAIGATYSSCESCPAAWSFTGSKISAEIGGYADIKYPILRVGGYPVIILPRIVIPLKSKRQTGLLEPFMQLGSLSGLTMGFPYYWAIARNQDLTVTPLISEKRGLKFTGEYRYVLSNESFGQINAATMNDRVFNQQVGRPAGNDFDQSRGFVNYKHYYLLPENFIQRAEIKYVSDLRYTRDFNLELPGHGDTALENRASITKNWKSHHASAEAAIYQNLTQADPFADSRNSVHRLPEIRYALIDRPIWGSWLFGGLNVNYTNFSRMGLSFDDFADGDANGSPDSTVDASGDRKLPLGDGDYRPDMDLLRTGQRLDITPVINIPLQLLPGIDFHSRIIYRETLYLFSTPEPSSTYTGPRYTDDAARRYLQTDFAFRTQFSGLFGSQDDEGTRFRHTIQPEIQYTSIPWIHRPSHPFFGDFSRQPFSRSLEPISDADFIDSFATPTPLQTLNKLQFDYNDRIFDQRLVFFNLNSNLVRKRREGGRSVYKNIVKFRMSQSYDFVAAAREPAYPLGTLNTQLAVREDFFETLTSASHFHYANLTNVSSRLRILDNRRNFLELSYSRIYTLNSLNTESIRTAENWGMGAGFSSKYINFLGGVQFSPETKELQAWRYLATFMPPGNCWAIEFGQEKAVSAPDVRFVFNFHFLFGGDT